MNNKKAFTLGELLVVFVIIGIVAAIGMSVVKPFEKAYKYSYTRIFTALSVAIYNHMATVAGVDAFPDNPQSFCNALVSFMNTSNDAEHSDDNPCNKTTGNDAFLVGDEPTLADFTGGKNPKIRLSNGAWLWIAAKKDGTDLVPFTYTQDLDGSNSDTIKYYIVYADLNGDRGPNKIADAESVNARHLPDIVAFAVTDTFAVIPFGYPKVDQRYLSAHIMFPISEDVEESSADNERPSGSMTYYEALVGAYGSEPDNIITNGVVQTYDLESSLSDDNPFKLVGKGTLDGFYVNAPEFNKDVCGDGKTSAQIKSDNEDSHCEIKVFSYN